MTINEAYEFLADIVQKPKNGWLTPKQINSYFKMAQWQEYESLIVVAEKNGHIMQQLQPFIVNTSLPVKAQYATLPPDWYMYANAFSKTFTNAAICGDEGTINTGAFRMLSLNELSDRLASNIPGRLPTVDHPAGVQQANLIQVFPIGTKQINIYYWRKPVDPIWNYTVVSGRSVYNPTGSVNWEFPDGKHYKLCARILFAMGISLRETVLSQYANELEAKTPA